MDFNDTEEEAAYRAKVRAWLSEAAPRYRPVAFDEASMLRTARRWQAEKAEAGFACITWPKEWGGQGGNQMQQVIFSQEEAAYALPRGVYEIGLGMCMPTVMKVASEADKRRFVGPAVRGEEIWCQLFSEPAAGSDLAGIRTRAARKGDTWLVDGQKVWTTNAHLADFGLLLTRSDFGAPKHKGLTMFWVDMRAPGIEVRPIHQISGKSSFNEVFFTGVEISDSQRLGAEGEGWGVALVTLMNERMAVGGHRGPDTPEIIALARSLPSELGTVMDDHAFRERLADWHVRSEGLKLARFRMLTALSRGETPGAGASFGKIVATNQLQDVTRELMDHMDAYGIISDPSLAPGDGEIQKYFLQSPGSRIAGGPDEILKNIIAERVLGLPTDLRSDKGVPFNELPTGA